MSKYIEVKTLEIAGFRSAVEALRLPFGKECRSETYARIKATDERNYTQGINYECGVAFDVEGKDMALLSTLVKRGDEHSKVVRGIIVYAEINAPRYFWAEADTYKVGSERLSSESTMHIQGRGLNTEDLIKMKSELTEGTMQRRVQYFSYQTLRRIYYQRKDHRLPHWHEFCEWVETLPFAKELILIK